MPWRSERETPLAQLREAAVFGLLVLGLVGWLLPIIPGTPSLIAGVALLAADHPRLQPWAARLKPGWSLLTRKQT